MKKALLAICTLLVLVSPDFAATIKNAVYYTRLITCVGGGQSEVGTNCNLNIGTNNGYATIASLTLPPGAYLISATPTFYTTTEWPSLVFCEITAPALGKANRGLPFSQTTVGATDSYATLAVHGVWTLTAPTSVTLYCGTNNDINVNTLIMTATQVDASVRQ